MRWNTVLYQKDGAAVWVVNEETIALFDCLTKLGLKSPPRVILFRGHHYLGSLLKQTSGVNVSISVDITSSNNLNQVKKLKYKGPTRPHKQSWKNSSRNHARNTGRQ